MENKLSYCGYLLCDADFQLLKMLVVCGWGVGSGWDSHGESLAVVPGLAWMKIWVGASKVSCNAFFIVYYHPLKRFFCPWGGRKRSNLAGAVFVSSCWWCCSQRKRLLKYKCSPGFCQPCWEEQWRPLGWLWVWGSAAGSFGGQEQVLGQQLKAVLGLPMKRMVPQRSASRFLSANVNSKDLNTAASTACSVPLGIDPAYWNSGRGLIHKEPILLIYTSLPYLLSLPLQRLNFFSALLYYSNQVDNKMVVSNLKTVVPFLFYFSSRQ